MKRDVGKAGESYFESICSGEYLSANRSDVDRYGWDYHVQYVPEHLKEARNTLAGMHNQTFSCLIQVKSTMGNKSSYQVPLYQLNHLATSKLPAFIWVNKFGVGISPERTYLVHVDEKLIKRTLEAVATKRQKNPEVDLAKHSLSVSFGDEHLVLPEVGEVRKSLDRYIGMSEGEYIKAKEAFLSQVGWEDGNCTFKFRIEGEDQLNDFVDFSIGVTSSLEVKSLVLSPKRFGLSGPETLYKKAVMTYPNGEPKAKGKLRVKVPGRNAAICLDAALRIPPGLNHLPLALQKFRITTDVIELVCTPEDEDLRANVFYRLDPKKRVRLRLLRTWCVLLKSAFQDGALGEVTFQPENGAPRIKYSPTQKQYDNNVLDEWPGRALEALKNLEALAEKLDIDDEIEVSLDDLSESQSMNDALLDVLRNNHTHIYKLEFEPNQPIEANVPAVCIFTFKSKVGQLPVYALLKIEVPPIQEDERWVVASNAPEVLGIVYEDGDPQEAIDEYNELLEGARRRYAESRILIVSPDEP